MRRIINVIGTPIDIINMEETLDRIEELVQIGRRSGKYHQIATVNADFAVKALYDSELRYLLQTADMATADGMPMVWGARLLGSFLEDRVAGADLVPALAERAAHSGLSIYLLGAGPGIAAKAADILRERHPGLKIVGVKSPPFSPIIDMDPGIVEEIKAADPDILMVAFGNPKQEKWIGMHSLELSVPVMIGIGGSLDFITGNTRRAPRWMQQFGIEWIHRLLCDPRRLWRRYVIDLILFNFYFIRQWLTLRPKRTSRNSLSIHQIDRIGDILNLDIEGELSRDTDLDFIHAIHRYLEETPYISLRLANVNRVDSIGLGALMSVTNAARALGGGVVLYSVPKSFARNCSLLKLDHFVDLFENKAIAISSLHSMRSDLAGSERLLESESIRVNGTEWIVIKAPGRLDTKVSNDFKGAASQTLSKNPFLIVDFSETQLITSAGLAALRDLNSYATRMKGYLRLTCTSKEVGKTLGELHPGGNVNLYPDIASAIAK